MSSDSPPSTGGGGDAPKQSAPPNDFIQRGVYGSDLRGTATFIGLRALDPFLQYQILAGDLGPRILSTLGLAAIPLGSAVAGSGLLARLSDLPLPRLLALGMSVGSAAKHIFWVTRISNEPFPARSATVVSLFNTVFNSVNSLLLVASATSASLAAGPDIPIPGTGCAISLPVALGFLFYAVGTVSEIASEVQRKHFKGQPENKGQICTTGWWGLARHINYGAYTLWRAGYALASGSWPAALAIGAFHTFQFASSGTVELDGYMAAKYGEQWSRYKADVPWLLFPYLY